MANKPTPDTTSRQLSLNEYLIAGDEYLKQHPANLVAREKELARISNILMRRDANNIIMTGPVGVGTTAMIMRLEACKNDPNTPYDISGKKFFWLDTDALFSSSDMGAMQKNFERVLAMLSNTSNSVLIIQNAKEFIDAAKSRNCLHFISGLMLELGNQKFQAILECRDNQLSEILGSHPHMRQTFSVCEINEPDPSALKTIVTAAAQRLETFHAIGISPEAIEAAIRLTEQFHIPQLEIAQPGRALALLDFALTSYRHAAHAIVPDNKDALSAHFNAQAQDGNDQWSILHRQIRRVQGELRAAEKSLAALDAKGAAEQAQKLQTTINEKKTAYEQIEKEINGHLVLTAGHVCDEFSRISHIPVDNLNSDEAAKLLELESDLSAGILGQDETIKGVTDAVRSGKLGLKSKDEPVASFIFLGPSGTGKTALAERLAHCLFQDKEALQVYDMSEYSGDDGVKKFTDKLVENMRRRPYCVNIFDEIEKGNPKIPDLFLQINDKGRLTDSSGLVATFANAINIVTSNIGQDYFYQENLPFPEAAEKARTDLSNAKQSGFRNEVLSRFTGIFCFRPLEEKQLIGVAKRQFQTLGKQLREKGLELAIPSDSDLFALCRDHYVRRKGARSIQKYLRENIGSDISLIILKNPGVKGSIKATYDSQTKRVVATFEPQTPAAIPPKPGNASTAQKPPAP